MRTRIETVLTLAAITLGLAIAQSDSDSKMTTSGKDKMMTLDKMSKEEKAAMFDKMSETVKMMATKMAGHDMTK